jgi:hypothetical protein
MPKYTPALNKKPKYLNGGISKPAGPLMDLIANEIKWKIILLPVNSA